MSEYTVYNDATKRTITFEWNDPNPPTDADMDEIFSAAEPQKLFTPPDRNIPPTIEQQRSVMGIASPNDLKAAQGAKTFVKGDIPNVASTAGARIGAGIEQSTGGLIQSLGESPEDSIYGNDAVREIGGFKVDPREIVAKGKEIAAEGRMVSETVDREKPLQTRAGKILGSTVESIGANIPGMTATMVTGNPALGLSMMGLQTFGQAYDEARSKGVSIEDATNSAAIQGGTEVATELAPFIQLAKFLKPGKLSTKVLNQYLAEVPGEHVATAVQNATGKYYNDPNATDEQRKQAAIQYLASPEHGQDQIDTFFTTLMQTAIMGGMAKAATSVSSYAEKRRETVNNNSVPVPDTGIQDDSMTVDDAIKAATDTVAGKAPVAPVESVTEAITPAVVPSVQTVTVPETVPAVDNASRVESIRARLEAMRRPRQGEVTNGVSGVPEEAGQAQEVPPVRGSNGISTLIADARKERGASTLPADSGIIPAENGGDSEWQRKKVEERSADVPALSVDEPGLQTVGQDGPVSVPPPVTPTQSQEIPNVTEETPDASEAAAVAAEETVIPETEAGTETSIAGPDTGAVATSEEQPVPEEVGKADVVAETPPIATPAVDAVRPSQSESGSEEKQPWEEASKNIDPYIKSLGHMTDAQLKAEEKRTTAELNTYGTHGVNASSKPGGVPYFEASGRFNAVNREIETRKSNAAPATPPPSPMAVKAKELGKIDPRTNNAAWRDLGDKVALNLPPDSSVMKPTQTDFKYSAKKLGIPVSVATRAWSYKMGDIDTAPKVAPPPVVETQPATDKPADMPDYEAPKIPFSPEQAIKVAADDISQLRPSDVYRVLDEAGKDHMEEVAEYILNNHKGNQQMVDATLDARMELRKGVAPEFNENREYTIAAQRPGFTKDDLKTVADVVKAFKEDKITYGKNIRMQRAYSQEGTDYAVLDKVLDDIPADAKITVAKDKVTITVKGAPLTEEQKAQNKVDAEFLTANAEQMRQQADDLEKLDDAEVQEKYPSEKYDAGTKQRRDEADGKRQYEVMRLRKAIDDAKIEATGILTAKSKDTKHVFFFEGDRYKQGANAGGKLLSVTGSKSMGGKDVDSARKLIKQLTAADKAFADNPILTAEDGYLVYNGKSEVGKPIRYRFMETAFNLQGTDASLNNGDTVRLSPGYLENKTDEVYLISRGAEGQTFYAIGTGTTATQEEMQAIEAAITGKSVIQVAQWVAETAPDEGYKLIAKKVLNKLMSAKAHGFRFDLAIAHVGDKVDSRLGNGRGLTLTDGNEISVTLNGNDVTGKSGMSYETILHELVHAATTASIRDAKRSNDPRAKQLIEDLYDIANQVKEQHDTLIDMGAKLPPLLESSKHKWNNAFDGPEEILTWSFTSRDMQDFMESIPYKQQTLWSRFVDTIRKILGFESRENTALSEILRVGEEFMADNEFAYNPMDKSAGAKNYIQSPVGVIANQQKNTTDETLSDFQTRYDSHLDEAEKALDAGDPDKAVEWLDKAAEIEREWLASLEAQQTATKPPKEDDPEVKVRGLAQNVEDKAIMGGLIANEGDLGELPTYKVRNMAEAAARVSSLLDTDYDRALRIIELEEPAPEGLYPEDVFTGIRIRATLNGDVETLTNLLSSPVVSMGTTLGQRIKALDSGGDSLDPFTAMKGVTQKRKEDAERQGVNNPDAEAQAAEIARLKAELDEANAKLDAKYAEYAVKEIKKKAAKTSRPADRAERKAELDTEFKDLSRQLAKSLGLISANPMFNPETISILVSMARNRIEAGINTAGGVIDSIHEEVKDLVKGVKKRHIRDAISNYGKTQELSKDEVDVTLRELKRQWLLVSKIEDATRGQLPEKTGMQRDQKSDELRLMEKELHQIMKKNGLDQLHSTEEHMKTALDAVKTRLKNEIADLDRQIADQKRDPVQKTGVKYDAEALKLKEIRDEKKAILDSLDAKPGITEQRRVEIAINALERSIEEYKRQIATGDFKRKVTQDSPETPGIKKLRDERDALQKVRDEKRALRAEMEKQGVPDEDPLITELNKFMADTERKIKAQQAALDKSIEEYERRIAENDLQPEKKRSGTPEIPGTQRKKAVLAALKETYEQMKKDAQPPKDPEASRLQSLKTRLTNEIAKYEGMMQEGLFDQPAAKVPTNLDAEGRELKRKRDQAKENYRAAVDASGTITKEEAAEIVRLSKVVTDARDAMENGGDRLAYGAARVAYENFVNDLKGVDAPLKVLFRNRVNEAKTTWQSNKSKAVLDATRDTLSTITDNSIAMVASFDNSFMGRQGLKTLFTHPSAWYPGALKSFSDFVRTLGGANTHDALLADIYSRPNFLNGEYLKAKIIVQSEEQYPTSLPERVPLLGRVFKASEYAFKGSALRMRSDLYDLLSDKAKELGVDMTDKVQVESLGKLINSLTARGKWGKTGEPAVVRLLLWAPKMLKGNIDVLTAHNFGAGLESGFARKEAAYNLVKIISITASIMALANALLPGSAEDDPRSSDFGKIKIGNTRFDITGGAGSIVTLAARILTRATKSTETGLVTPYGLGYGKSSPFTALIDFLVNKVTPPAGIIISWMKGKNREGEPFTFGDAAYRSMVPISVQNAIKMRDDVSADAVAAVIADLVGINANTYSDTGTQRRDMVNRIRRGKPLTDKQQEIFDKLDSEKKRSIKKDAKVSALTSKLRNLPIADLANAAEVAPEGIKQDIAVEFRKKFYHSKGLDKATRDRYKSILAELQQY